MTDNPRLRQLLDELLDSQATPEEVCRSCPELLPEVRARWQRMCRARAEVDALFPAPTEQFAEPAAPPPKGVFLPQIPGYDVEAVLGHGGVGVVYQARHLALKRTVALKMLLAGPAARPEELERFLREAEAVAGLRHPNIVPLYDVGEVEGRPYFTMEAVEGGRQDRKLAGPPLPARQAAALVAAVADAMQAAHQAGVIHRDLKPANVLLTVDGTPKVTDFGLARRVVAAGGSATLDKEGGGGLTRSGATVGTPSYMAPEQARGDKDAIGPATDVYALGAILYECLTGRPPFRAESATATLRQVVADEPVHPARLNPRVSRDLETICLKCLHKEPQRRYASAAALADDLRHFERGEPILARPPGPLELAVRWARRRPTAAVLLAAGVVMLAGLTGAAVWYVGDRARLHYEDELRRAEVQNRRGQVNREADDALDQAERHLKDLRASLEDPVWVRELLSDIDRWQAMVEQVRQACQRARSACVGNEALVREETRARLQTVEATLASEEANYRLARDLDDIWAEALTSVDGRPVDVRTTKARYAAFFARQGVDLDQADTARLASALQSSPIRYALVAGLDYWAVATAVVNRKDPQLALLLQLARTADPDLWRDRFRNTHIWGDRAALSRLAAEVDVERQSPMILATLGRLLTGAGGDARSLYKRALLRHPRDFWLHFRAASDAREPEVRVGLYLAAIAIRPTSALAYNNLSFALREQKDLQAAAAAARRMIELDPKSAVAHNTLGLALREDKDLPGAIAEYRKAIELHPGYVAAHYNLGNALIIQGDLPGAAAALERAIGLEPGNFRASHILGMTRQRQHQYAEAEQAYLGAIKAQPAFVPAYDSLARLLATCPDDKVRDGKRAIQVATTACERTDWKEARYLDTLATAYAEAGQFEEAIRQQTRALDDPTFAARFGPAGRQRLELYQRNEPFREP